MLRYSLSALCASLLLLGATACDSKPDSVTQAQDANEKKIENATPTSASSGAEQQLEEARKYDTDFMTKAASGGMLEVQLGQQVAAKALSPQAKMIGEQMVKDHGKANDELKAMASKMNVTLPTTLGKDQQAVYDDVLAAKGSKLDKEYLDKMETDHKEDIKAYEEASTKAASPELRAFAAKMLPTLRMHEAMIEKAKPAITALK